MNSLFEFVTMSFPKAGVQVGSLPVTINMFLFVFTFFISIKYLAAYLASLGVFVVPYVLLILFTFFTIVININNNTITLMDIAMTGVLIFSPLAGMMMYAIEPEKSVRIIGISSIITGGFMIIQKSYGILQTAVAGITYTLGQELTEKNIGYNGINSGALGEAAKMPSTYQNGNGVGIFLALSLTILMVWEPLVVKDRVIRAIALVCDLSGLVLCGSRSIVFPMIIVGFIMLKQYYTISSSAIRRRVVWVMSLVIVGAVVFLISHTDLVAQLYYRYVTQTLQNPTSDRGDMWKAGYEYVSNLSTFKLVAFVFFGAPNTEIGSDGMMGFFLHQGLVAQILLVICLWIPIVILFKQKKSRIVAYGLVAVFIAFTIDMSFYYLPSVMNYYMIFAVATRYVKNDNIISRQQI